MLLKTFYKTTYVYFILFDKHHQDSAGILNTIPALTANLLQ